MIIIRSFDDNCANLTRCGNAISHCNLLMEHIAKSKKNRSEGSGLRVDEIPILALGIQAGTPSGIVKSKANRRNLRSAAKLTDSTIADARNGSNFHLVQRTARRSGDGINKQKSVGSVFDLFAVTNSGLIPGNVRTVTSAYRRV